MKTELSCVVVYRKWQHYLPANAKFLLHVMLASQISRLYSMTCEGRVNLTTFLLQNVKDHLNTAYGVVPPVSGSFLNNSSHSYWLAFVFELRNIQVSLSLSCVSSKRPFPQDHSITIQLKITKTISFTDERLYRHCFCCAAIHKIIWNTLWTMLINKQAEVLPGEVTQKTEASSHDHSHRS